jgi:hypothetical protein
VFIAHDCDICGVVDIVFKSPTFCFMCFAHLQLCFCLPKCMRSVCNLCAKIFNVCKYRIIIEHQCDDLKEWFWTLQRLEAFVMETCYSKCEKTGKYES